MAAAVPPIDLRCVRAGPDAPVQGPAAAPLVARRSAARVVGLAAEKLAAKKAKPAATQALLCLSEACGPSWVLAQLQVNSYPCMCSR